MIAPMSHVSMCMLSGMLCWYNELCHVVSMNAKTLRVRSSLAAEIHPEDTDSLL